MVDECLACAAVDDDPAGLVSIVGLPVRFEFVSRDADAGRGAAVPGEVGCQCQNPS